MCKEHPTWGAPRMQSELKILDHNVVEITVAKYMLRVRKPPSKTWRTFLYNLVPELATMVFLTVPTATFWLL